MVYWLEGCHSFQQYRAVNTKLKKQTLLIIHSFTITGERPERSWHKIFLGVAVHASARGDKVKYVPRNNGLLHANFQGQNCHYSYDLDHGV